MTEKCVDGRFTAAESNKAVHCRAAAAAGQNFVQPFVSDLRIENTFLLEEGEGIRREHFSPLIAVVACGIAARKDMREGVGKTVVLRRESDRDFFSDCSQDLFMTYPEYYTPGFLFSWSIISP